MFVGRAALGFLIGSLCLGGAWCLVRGLVDRVWSVSCIMWFVVYWLVAFALFVVVCGLSVLCAVDCGVRCGLCVLVVLFVHWHLYVLETGFNFLDAADRERAKVYHHTYLLFSINFACH